MHEQIFSRRTACLAGLGAAPLLAAPAASGQLYYDVKQFGATARKGDKATKPIQAAVDAAFAAGGGNVLIPPGEYTSGPVQIKSNVTVHIEAGATVYVSRDPAEFPRGQGRRALFHGTDVENVAITGKGKIDGQGTWEWRLPDQNAYTTRPIQREIDIARAAGLDMRYYHITGPAISSLAFTRAVNVKIEDVTFVNSSGWCMPLTQCDRVFIRGIHLYSDLDKAVNSDGIDLVSSKNVVISDCIFETADDCISLKTRRGGDPIENVTVSNCILTSSSSAFVIGVETWSDIHHVLFTNSVIRNANRGFRIAVWNGCTVHDVIFSNLTIDLNRRHYNWWGNAEAFNFVVWQENAESPLGRIRDVLVENVLANARGTSAILGPRIEDVSISNFRTAMMPEKTPDKRATHALRVEGVRGFRLRDYSAKWDLAKLEPQWGSALYLKDVDDYEIDGFRGRQAQDGAAILVENTTRGVIRNSRAAEGCATFLEVRGERSQALFAFANDTSAASRKLDVTGGATASAVRLGEPA
jgi:hypothetical protein